MQALAGDIERVSLGQDPSEQLLVEVHARCVPPARQTMLKNFEENCFPLAHKYRTRVQIRMRGARATHKIGKGV